MSYRPRTVEVVLAGFLALSVASGITRSSGQADTTEGVGLIERVKALEKRVDQGIAVGSIVFTVSDQPPGKDWAACDGKATFPPEAPAHLRGKQVPNMQDALVAVGGTIGERKEGSLITQKVEGKIFKLPDPTTKRMQEGKGNATNLNWKGGLVTIFTANEDYKSVEFGTSAWKCFGGEMQSAPADYLYHPKGTALTGDIDIAPPPFVRLRAYARIR